MNQKLASIAATLFKSWFIDFDPVIAKAEGRKPFGLNPEIATLFPSSFDGEIPSGWKVSILGEVAQNPRHGAKPQDTPPWTPYFGLQHMPRKCITLEDWGTAAEVVSGKFRFKKGEILFGKLRPYFHKVAVAPVDGVCSTDILVVTPKIPAWFGFVLGHVSNSDFIEYVDAASGGTRMPRTDWATMSRYQVALPSLEISERFTSIIRPIINKLHNNADQNRKLAKLRDTLLPPLSSGEIRLKQAEKLVAEIA